MSKLQFKWSTHLKASCLDIQPRDTYDLTRFAFYTFLFHAHSIINIQAVACIPYLPNNLVLRCYSCGKAEKWATTLILLLYGCKCVPCIWSVLCFLFFSDPIKIKMAFLVVHTQTLIPSNIPDFEYCGKVVTSLLEEQRNDWLRWGFTSVICITWIKKKKKTCGHDSSIRVNINIQHQPYRQIKWYKAPVN